MSDERGPGLSSPPRSKLQASPPRTDRDRAGKSERRALTRPSRLWQPFIFGVGIKWPHQTSEKEREGGRRG